ncbi:zinc finger CCCH domain-containing protein 13-like [Engraulis encrasicolus]|uniref:zinc finger CCCH domain-containing protein 13-like n=1 Tax=Engraulis encrasicolus TaxID=184585 RepID=UPI002FD4058A
MAEQGLSWEEILDLKMMREKVWLNERIKEMQAFICKEVEYKVMNAHESWEANEKKHKNHDDERVVRTCQDYAENMMEKCINEKVKWEEKRIQDKERHLEDEWKKMEAERSKVEEMKVNDRIELEVLRKRLKEGVEKLRESETMEKQRKKVLGEERDNVEKDRIKLRQERREVAELKAELDQRRLELEGVRLQGEEEKRRLNEDRERMRKEQEQHLKELVIQREKLEQSEVALKEKAAQKKEKFLLKKQELESERQTIENEKKKMAEELKAVQEKVYVLKSQQLEEEGRSEVLRTQEAINRANVEQEWRMFEIEKRRQEDQLQDEWKKMEAERSKVEEMKVIDRIDLEVLRKRLKEGEEKLRESETMEKQRMKVLGEERDNVEKDRIKLRQERREVVELKAELDQRRLELEGVRLQGEEEKRRLNEDRERMRKEQEQHLKELVIQREKLEQSEVALKEKAAQKKEKFLLKKQELESERQTIENEKKKMAEELKAVQEKVYVLKSQQLEEEGRSEVLRTQEAINRANVEQEWRMFEIEKRRQEDQLQDEWKKMEAERSKVEEMKVIDRIDLEVLRKRLKEGEEKLRESETMEKQRKKVLDEDRDNVEKDRIKLRQERREVAELKAELDQRRLELEGVRLQGEEEKRRLNEDRERMRKEQEQHLKELVIQREKLEQSEVALKEKAAQKKAKFLLKKQELESERQTIENEKKKMAEELKAVQEKVYVLKSQLLEEEGRSEVLRTQEAISRANVEQEWRMFEIEKRRHEDQLEMERKNIETQRLQLQQEKRSMKEEATMNKKKMEIEKRRSEDEMEAQQLQLQEEERQIQEKAALMKAKMAAEMKENEEEWEKIEQERRSLERTVREMVTQRKKDLEDEWDNIDSERKGMEARLERQRQRLAKMEKEHWDELEKEEERILDKLNAEKRKIERQKKWLDTERKELDSRIEMEKRDMEIQKEKLEATEKRLLYKHALRQQRGAMREMEAEEEWTDIQRQIESEKQEWLNNDAKTSMEPVSDIVSCSMDADETFPRKPKAGKGAEYEKQKHAVELSPSDSDDDPCDGDWEATPELRKPMCNIALKQIVKIHLEEGPVMTDSPVKNEGTDQDKTQPRSNVEITDSRERSDDNGNGMQNMASAETKSVGNCIQASSPSVDNNSALKSIEPRTQVQQIVTDNSPVDTDVNKSKSALVVETSEKEIIPLKSEGIDKDNAIKHLESVPAKKENDVSDQDHPLLQQKASGSNSQSSTIIPKTLQKDTVCTLSPNTMDEKPAANPLPPMTAAKSELNRNCAQDNTAGQKENSSLEESLAPQIQVQGTPQPLIDDNASGPSPGEMDGKPPANPPAPMTPQPQGSVTEMDRNDSKPSPLVDRKENIPENGEGMDKDIDIEHVESIAARKGQVLTTDGEMKGDAVEDEYSPFESNENDSHLVEAKIIPCGTAVEESLAQQIQVQGTPQPLIDDNASGPSPGEMDGKPQQNPPAPMTAQPQGSVTEMDRNDSKPSPLVDRIGNIPENGEVMDKDIDIEHVESVAAREGEVLTTDGEMMGDAVEDDEYSPWEGNANDSHMEEAKIIPSGSNSLSSTNIPKTLKKNTVCTPSPNTMDEKPAENPLPPMASAKSESNGNCIQDNTAGQKENSSLEESLALQIQGQGTPQPLIDDNASGPSPGEMVGKPQQNPPAPMTAQPQGFVTEMDQSDSKPSPLVDRKQVVDKDIDIEHVESVTARKGQVLTNGGEMKGDAVEDEYSPFESNENDSHLVEAKKIPCGTAVEESLALQIQVQGTPQPFINDNASGPSPGEMVGKPPAPPAPMTAQPEGSVTERDQREMVGKPQQNPPAPMTAQPQGSVTERDQSDSKPSPLVDRIGNTPEKGEGIDKNIDIEHVESVAARKGQVLTTDGEMKGDAVKDDEYSPFESNENHSHLVEAKIIPYGTAVEERLAQQIQVQGTPQPFINDNASGPSPGEMVGKPPAPPAPMTAQPQGFVTEMDQSDSKPSPLVDRKQVVDKDIDMEHVESVTARKGQVLTTDGEMKGDAVEDEYSPFESNENDSHLVEAKIIPCGTAVEESLALQIQVQGTPQARKNGIASGPFPGEMDGKPPAPPAPMTAQPQGSVTERDQSESKPSPLVDRIENIPENGEEKWLESLQPHQHP